MTRMAATGVGFIAVALWATLAVFTVMSAPIPPFQLTAMSFLVGAAAGFVWLAVGGGFGLLRKVSSGTYAFGIAALFLYHALYFSALRLAPPAQAGLIAYLWPLLIVLFSGLLPGERLRAGHIIGALISFGGVILILLPQNEDTPTAAYSGYAIAFLCALTWAGYSVLSRRLSSVPTQAVAVFCLGAAILSGVAHVLFETTHTPTQAMVWFSVLMLGLGPVGLAFYAWDFGVKFGDIQMLGVASYAAPVLSTLILVVFGFSQATIWLAAAAALVAAGAVLAARARGP